MRTWALAVVSGLAACGGVGGSRAPVSAVDPAAASYQAHGLSVERPSGWTFVEPDQSLAPDTAVVLQGPEAAAAMAPVVEIGRRPLNASERRFAARELMSSMVMEIVQTYDAFENVAGPEAVQVAGKPASRLTVKLTLNLPNGNDVMRLGRIYSVVDGAQIWVIRCLGPTDGSADAAFDAIISSVRLGG